MQIDKQNKRARSFTIQTIIIFALALFAGFHIGYATKQPDLNSDNILTVVLNGFEHITEKPWQIYPTSLAPIAICLLIGAFIWSYSYKKYMELRKTMLGEESGTAEFETNFKKYNKQYVLDPAMKNLKQSMANSVILSNDIYLSLNTQFTQRNLNIIVLGGSGTGKSRFFVKPNILQANSSFVITDPSGDIMSETAGFLEKQGYIIKCFNIQDMTKSCRYNPFAYIKQDEDIPVMINCLMKNTNNGKTGGDPFWDKSETALYAACCGYLFEARPPEERNFANIMEMLRMVSADEENIADKEDELDKIFNEWESLYPKSFAVKNYKTFKMAPGKTKLSILITAAVRIGTFFDLDKVANLTCKDEMELDKVGSRKTAIFIVTPQGDTTYSFLVSMLYTQMFDALYKVGEELGETIGKFGLPIPVRCLIDEFANCGTIPDFEIKLATMRKYNISACPVLQSMAQLKKMYKDEWETIVGNCDTLLFLGGTEESTLKYLSEKMGKATIKTRSTTVNKGGRQGGGSANLSYTGRELMTSAEIGMMDNKKCLVLIRGCKPIYNDKYNFTAHPNYKYTAEANSNMLFVGKFKLNNEYEANSLNSNADYHSPNISSKPQVPVQDVKVEQSVPRNEEEKDDVGQSINPFCDVNEAFGQDIETNNIDGYALAGAYNPKYEFDMDVDFPYIPSNLEVVTSNIK